MPQPIRPWAVIRVPFPYVERPVRHHRPALVVAVPDPGTGFSLAWVLMITSRENADWQGDVAITDLAMAGLRHPSVVRTAKIATIDARDAEPIGILSKEDRTAAEFWMARYLGCGTGPSD
jgi:mRNA interferase MazF